MSYTRLLLIWDTDNGRISFQSFYYVRNVQCDVPTVGISADSEPEKRMALDI